MKLTRLAVATVLLTSLPIVHAANKAEDTNLMKAMFEQTALVLNLNKDEYHRAFEILHRYEAQDFTLPELDNMSDDLVLASIDLDSEPYVRFADNERALLRWRRLELRGELLAERVGISFEKFWPFYYSFPRTLYSSERLVAEHLKLRHRDSAWQRTHSDGDRVVVECSYACAYLAPDYRGSYADRVFELYREMSNWEAANGYLTRGTQATIVNSATGDKLLMERKLTGVAWQPVSASGSESVSCKQNYC
ncbi:hypothetical protein [Pseudidiomarina salilacus]|uniref:hypothetical protein n=1 Tax=Pseudidiomarina salilacus TaxID=3384452 RepID=UPI00398494DB